MASDERQDSKAGRGTKSGRILQLELDLERILQGGGPTWDEFATAPVLSRWRLIVHPDDGLPSLVGIVTGHPVVGPGPVITSPVVAISLTGDWARTVSRLYALGVPADGVLA